MELNKEKSKLLLHTCCAVCAGGLVEVLKNDYEIVLFFYNPNIQPQNEYEKRKKSAQGLSDLFSLQFKEGEYNPAQWLRMVKGYEKEPEGGKRCEVCFNERLLEAVKVAKELGYIFFTTTLLASHHKNENLIIEIGKAAGEKFKVQFLNLENLGVDKKMVEVKGRNLVKEQDFYRQKYCGCLFAQKLA